MRAALHRLVRSPVFAQAIALLLALLAVPALAQVPARKADIVLTDTISGEDHQTYIRAPFTLPEGTDRLVVAFDYDGREERTVIDLGIEDPNGFRGASGGNKASFTIAPNDATPSYLPGPLPPGEWALALAVPNIRDGVTTTWRAQIWFLRGAEAQWLPGPTIGKGPGWYRGDLHLHSGQSDGSCDSRGDKRVPCPVFRTLEAAAARGLDFVALTEHNTTSHAQALREHELFFDDMLLIPGREITTFFGHFNVFGVTTFVDFRVAPGIANSFEHIAEQVHALGGIVSINHPRLPSGEICMGCGWTMQDADLSLADAVEAINGSAAEAGGGPEGPVSGIPFWLEALKSGQHLTALGGSDNHDPAREGLGAIGEPTTVVFAADLSQPAILQGIREGRVFIDVSGQGGVHLDFTARAGGAQALMGGVLQLPSASPLEIAAEVEAPANATLELYEAGERIEAAVVGKGRTAHTFALPGKAGRSTHWLALRNEAGEIVAMSNALVIETE